MLKPLQGVAGIIQCRHTLPILSNALLQRVEARTAFIAVDIESKSWPTPQSMLRGKRVGHLTGAPKYSRGRLLNRA